MSTLPRLRVVSWPLLLRHAKNEQTAIDVIDRCQRELSRLRAMYEAQDRAREAAVLTAAREGSEVREVSATPEQYRTAKLTQAERHLAQAERNLEEALDQAASDLLADWDETENATERAVEAVASLGERAQSALAGDREALGSLRDDLEAIRREKAVA